MVSHDVTAAILVFQTNSVGVELFRHLNVSFFVVVVPVTSPCIDTGHVSGNTLWVEGLVSFYHISK